VFNPKTLYASYKKRTESIPYTVEDYKVGTFGYVQFSVIYGCVLTVHKKRTESIPYTVEDYKVGVNSTLSVRACCGAEAVPYTVGGLQVPPSSLREPKRAHTLLW
jgi:hypothetical protein